MQRLLLLVQGSHFENHCNIRNEPLELFRFFNLRTALGMQQTLNILQEDMSGIWLGGIYFYQSTFVNNHPIFSLNFEQFVASSGKQLVPNLNYPRRVYMSFFPLQYYLFNILRLESKHGSILA